MCAFPPLYIQQSTTVFQTLLKITLFYMTEVQFYDFFPQQATVQNDVCMTK
jgi:hypothetical protein